MSKFSRKNKSRFSHGSKFKNVVVKEYNADKAYTNVEVSMAPHKTGNFISCSHDFISFVSNRNAGAAIGVFHVDDIGAKSTPACIPAHKGKVTDVAASLHDPSLVAVSTDAGYLEVKKLAKGADETLSSRGITATKVRELSNGTDSLVVSKWNPVVGGTIASASKTTTSIWDVSTDTVSPLFQFSQDGEAEKESITDLAWSTNGATLITVTKTNSIQLIDPRSSKCAARLPEAHSGAGVCRVAVGDGDIQGNHFFTTGTTASRTREVTEWDSRMLESGSVHRAAIDHGTGSAVPYVDEDSGLLFVLGRGDTTLSLFDTTDNLTRLQRTVVSAHTSYGYTFLPKPCLDVFECEVGRLLNLTSKAVLPVGLHVPRRSHRELHDDLFPPTASTLQAALTSQEWMAGATSLPIQSPVLELQYKIGRTNEFFEEAYSQYIESKPESKPEPTTVKPPAPAEGDTALDSAIKEKIHAWLGYVPKFKNVTLKEAARDETVYNLVGAKEDCFAACSSRFAVPFQGGGGRVYCGMLSDVGKVGTAAELPMLDVHTRSVLSLQFSACDDRVLASGSDDYNICVWRLSNDAVTTQSSPWQLLEGHYAAVRALKFHPTVNHVLVSSGAGENGLKLWDVNACREAVNVEYNSVVEDWDWLYNGAAMIMLDANKQVRMVDPRSEAKVNHVEQAKSHEGSRSGFIRSIGNSPYILSSGQNKQGDRELKVWDTRRLDASIAHESFGSGLCSLEPHVIEDNGVVALTARGESTLKVLEFAGQTATDEDRSSSCKPFACANVSFSDPISATVLLPRNSCDVASLEVAKFVCYSPGTVRPSALHVPRSERLRKYFADDVYIPTRSGQPTLEADDWLADSSTTAVPLTMSLNKENIQVLSSVPADERNAPMMRSKANVTRFQAAKAKEQERAEERVAMFAKFEHLAAQYEEAEKDYQKKLASGSDDSDSWDSEPNE